MQFNDTTNKSGIIQTMERILYGEDAYGVITGNATKLKTATSEVNQALAHALSVIFETDGTFQFDDSNHTADPIVYTNLVSGQRDYHFLLDEQSNPILEIHKVAILPSATATLYQELTPMDELMGDNDILAESTATGVPTRYGKLSNGIFLETPSSYNATEGLKFFISREASYFTTSDTTKKPGFNGNFHEYLPTRAAWKMSGMKSAALETEMLRLEKGLRSAYARRERDVRKRITPRITPYI